VKLDKVQTSIVTYPKELELWTFAKDLDFSSYTALSTCSLVATSDDEVKFEIESSDKV